MHTYTTISPRLQFVVIDAIVAEDHEVVLLIALGCLVLDIPVILTCHEVVILLLVLVVDSFILVSLPLAQSVWCGQEVCHKLLPRLVHHTPIHTQSIFLLMVH